MMIISSFKCLFSMENKMKKKKFRKFKNWILNLMFIWYRERKKNKGNNHFKKENGNCLTLRFSLEYNPIKVWIDSSSFCLNQPVLGRWRFDLLKALCSIHTFHTLFLFQSFCKNINHLRLVCPHPIELPDTFSPLTRIWISGEGPRSFLLPPWLGFKNER